MSNQRLVSSGFIASSSSIDIPNDAAAEHTRNNTPNSSGGKRKSKNNDSFANDIQIQRQHDHSPLKRQHIEEDNKSKESTKINNDHTDDNATQSPMTLKLGITCVGNGIEENRKGKDPSPTTVGADLSRFNNDIPLESDPPSFDNKPAECGDGVVSPKKGKAISAVICCILLYGSQIILLDHQSMPQKVCRMHRHPLDMHHFHPVIHPVIHSVMDIHRIKITISQFNRHHNITTLYQIIISSNHHIQHHLIMATIQLLNNIQTKVLHNIITIQQYHKVIN